MTRCPCLLEADQLQPVPDAQQGVDAALVLIVLGVPVVAGLVGALLGRRLSRP